MEYKVLWQQPILNHNSQSFFSKDGEFLYVGKSPRGPFLKLNAETGKLIDKYPLQNILNNIIETEDSLYLMTDKKCHIINKMKFELVQIYQDGICNHSDSGSTNGNWLLTAARGYKSISCLNMKTGEHYKKKVDGITKIWHIKNDIFYFSTNEGLFEIEVNDKKIKVIYKIDDEKTTYDFAGVYLDVPSQVFYYLGFEGALNIVDLKTKSEKSIILDTITDHNIYVNKNKVFIGGGMTYGGGAYPRYSSVYEIDEDKLASKIIAKFDKLIVKAICPIQNKIVVFPLLTYAHNDKSKELLECIVF